MAIPAENLQKLLREMKEIKKNKANWGKYLLIWNCLWAVSNICEGRLFWTSTQSHRFIWCGWGPSSYTWRPHVFLYTRSSHENRQAEGEEGSPWRPCSCHRRSNSTLVEFHWLSPWHPGCLWQTSLLEALFSFFCFLYLKKLYFIFLFLIKNLFLSWMCSELCHTPNIVKYTWTLINMITCFVKIFNINNISSKKII